jgi:hypothetical protein
VEVRSEFDFYKSMIADNRWHREFLAKGADGFAIFSSMEEFNDAVGRKLFVPFKNAEGKLEIGICETNWNDGKPLMIHGGITISLGDYTRTQGLWAEGVMNVEAFPD